MPIECSTCDGRGEVAIEAWDQAAGPGVFETVIEDCETCAGKGERACALCDSLAVARTRAGLRCALCAAYDVGA